MKYDLDRFIERGGTGSIKWEFHQEGDKQIPWDQTSSHLGDARVLPLWVADMDFPCPQPVVDAIVARAQHPIYGYTERTETYFKAVTNWMERKQGWHIEREWVCTTPGVVSALNMAIQAMASSGETVVVQPPVYYPFFNAVRNNGGRLAENPLVYESGRYGMNLGDLERKLEQTQASVAILCNPHNPIGRVWSREELLEFGEICRSHNVLIVSDEIHGDLILPGHKFTPFASLGEKYLQNAIICTAPSKTFNIAGLHTSNIIIPNPDLRARFLQRQIANGLIGVNPFGLVALEAAYEHGEEWLDQVLEYVQENLTLLQEFVHEYIPEITVVSPEGTFLVWLDCRRLGLDAEQLHHLMMDQARVYLDEGTLFGTQGEGFERINIACPRTILVQVLERIRHAVNRQRMGALGRGGRVDGADSKNQERLRTPR